MATTFALLHDRYWLGGRCQQLLLLIVLGLSPALTVIGGCTEIHVHEANGRTRIEQRVGFVSIEPASERQGLLVYVEGLGFSRINNDFVLGWHRADFALLPLECRVVLWASTVEQVHAAAELLQDRSELCVMKPTGK